MIQDKYTVIYRSNTEDAPHELKSRIVYAFTIKEALEIGERIARNDSTLWSHHIIKVEQID